MEPITEPGQLLAYYQDCLAFLNRRKDNNSFFAPFGFGRKRDFDEKDKQGKLTGNKRYMQDIYWKVPMVDIEATVESEDPSQTVYVKDDRGYTKSLWVKMAFWQEGIEKYIDPLQKLFAPEVGGKSQYDRWTQIYIPQEKEAITVRTGKDGNLYLEFNAKEYHVWLHKPYWESMTQEQQMVWESYGKPEWIDLYNLEAPIGGDPFAKAEEEPEQEQAQQQPVENTVPVEEEDDAPVF